MLQKLVAAAALALALAVLGYLLRQTQGEPLDLGLYSSRAEILHQLADAQTEFAQELAAARLSLDPDPAQLGRISRRIQALEQAAASGPRSVAGIDGGIDAALHRYLQTAEEQRRLAQDCQEQLHELVSRFQALRQDAEHILATVLPAQAAAPREQIGALLDAVTTYSIQAVPADPESIEALARQLAGTAQALESPAQRSAVSGFSASAQALRAARDALQEATLRLSAVPTAQSLGALTAAYDEHYRLREAATGRYRLILALYAASLLLVFGVLGLRLRGSFRELDGINAELQNTNANLEGLVETRTQDLRKALDDLRMNEAQLIQSEKMASLGQMVAGLAHEINTPLAYVRSNVETVRGALGGLGRLAAGHPEAGESFGEADALLGDSEHGLGQIAELVMSLKNFSRVDRSHTELFDVNEGLDTAIRICGNQIKDRIQVERDYGKLPRIACAPSQLNQVFLNILTNAAQAIEGEGLIRVRTRDAGAQLEISIRDSGCGMDAQTRAHIFEPFFTTKEVGQGTGLGLSIVFRIVEDHRGAIRVDSAPGAGTEFTIVLPKSPAPAPEAAAAAAALA